MSEVDLHEEIRRAALSILVNVSNFPEPGPLGMIGVDMSPLAEKIANAAVERVGDIEWEYGATGFDP